MYVLLYLYDCIMECDLFYYYLLVADSKYSISFIEENENQKFKQIILDTIQMQFETFYFKLENLFCNS